MPKVIVKLKDEQMRKEIYKLIDKSIYRSFLGGVLLGLYPFLNNNDWFLVSVIALVVSLLVFFSSRYMGLRFLFAQEDLK